MERLISSWYKDGSLPESYIFPPDIRPGKFDVPTCNKIPVIDLGNADNNLVEQLLKASQDFGMFQVVNHGVSEELLNDTRSVSKEFFEMPAEDRGSLISDDQDERKCKVVTGSLQYNTEKVHQWRDNLKHPCHPLEECIKSWPQNPTRYREVMAAYSIEVISNKKLKSAEHRVVTNSSEARTSVVFFIFPSSDSNIEPATSLVDETNPPLCRAFQSKEFMRNFYMQGEADLALQPFQLET
ncbi:Oxoglutarate/iron-dependent dioxygenase [Corchorus capsularis]|uniref:Oxoglutarate/iron-dependent dioxygenase n=1 Tax=Corchorus capsularis TaxID=210143 RepID=A0A1R3K7R2_COCAP|nr:Oxoglutarate/iron-dependent dioxygenase [Corchorus capsularis]